ncbi:unnamed protein product [Clonostachys rosea]|uniref:Disintegrin domain-containing protein n=1 Tax=Bionectria ochroleuca TaxID=29856 RepID=A0ABY6UY63_BIOOC|nr:unnamed protein product [Clonostachys rosea]
MKLPLFVAKAASPATLPSDILVYNTSENADNTLDHAATDLLVVYQKATTDRLLPRDLFSPLLFARDNEGPNCASGEVACQNSCIPKGADCCGGTFYCNAGSYCTKDGCCADGSVCDNQKCEDGQDTCGSGCMPKGSTCCGSSYCGSGSVCSKDNTCSPSSSSKPSAAVQTAQSDKPTSVKSATSDNPTTSDQPTSTSTRPKTTTSDKPSTSTKPTSTVPPTTSQTSTSSDNRTTELISTTTSASSTTSSTEISTSNTISTDTSLSATTTIDQDLAAILQTAIPTSAQTDPEARCFLMSGHATQYTTPAWYTTLPSDLQSYYASATVEASATAQCTPTNTPPKPASQESALPAPAIGALIGAAAFVAGVVTLLILLARSGKLPWLSRRKSDDLGDTSDGAELIPVREKATKHLSFEHVPTGGMAAPSSTLSRDSRLYISPPPVPATSQTRAADRNQVVEYDWPIAPSPVASPGRSSFQPSPVSSNARFTPPITFGAEWAPPKEGPRAS